MYHVHLQETKFLLQTKTFNKKLVLALILLQPPDKKRHKVNLKIDDQITYLHDFEKDDEETRKLVENAQQHQEIGVDAKDWNSKYKLLEPIELLRFATNVYEENSVQSIVDDETEQASPWKLLYQAKGTVLKKWLDGFYGELYFNTENHYLLLVVKGTSSLGNVISDIKNVYLGFKGGEMDSAFTFGEKVRELMLKFKCKPMLMTTGHSLGGYLAQIVTYTITYCYLDQDKAVRSRETPSDDFGIHTVVFDSPATYNQISSIDPRDPLDMTRFMLPITNFIAEVNIVNSSSAVGSHLGLVLALKDFKVLEKPSLTKKYFKTFENHSTTNFKEFDPSKCYKIENLQERNTVKYDKKEIPSFMFSTKKFERLQKYYLFSPLSAELVDQLPKFSLTNTCVLLDDTNFSAEQFIPRAHSVLSRFEVELDNGVFDGKHILEIAIFNMWKAEMLKDYCGFSLSDEWKQKVLGWKDGTKIGGFASYKEMRMFGCMIHNSIPGCYHYDLSQFKKLDEKQVDNFSLTNEATLILIVENKDQQINHIVGRKVKILYLLLESNAAELVNLNLSIC